MTLSEILARGYLEVAEHTKCPIDAPELALGELEALAAFCRLEVARHQNARDVANSYDGRQALEAVEVDLLSAMQGIGSAIDFIERDVTWLATEAA